MKKGKRKSRKTEKLFGLSIHKMSLNKLPKFEMFEEGNQIRRSSKSVKSNIVEGYGRRRYKQDFIKFLIYSIQIGFRKIRRSYFYSQQSKKLHCNRLLQCFLMKLWVKRTSIKTEKLFGLSIYALSSNDETIDHLETLFETGSLTDEECYLSIHKKIDLLGRKMNNFISSVEKNHNN